MVERLLTAAGQILMAEGFERATTNRIADMAGVSVGSLYQFFPNKLATLHELQGVWTARLGTELDLALARPHRSLADLVDEVLGVHVRLQRESAGLLGFLLTNTQGAAHQSVRTAVLERLEQITIFRRPGSDPALNRLIAQMAIHVTDALYTLAPGGTVDLQVRSQVRQALLGYLSSALGLKDREEESTGQHISGRAARVR